MSFFIDGGGGQNKSTIIVAMLLYVVTQTLIIEISLRFFEPNHGGNEGDSAHSTIGYSVNHACDLYVPSQKVPAVMKLARRKALYTVNQMGTNDFIDFKNLFKDLRILQMRQDNETERRTNWAEIVEVQVKKSEPNTIFFRISYFNPFYRSV